MRTIEELDKHIAPYIQGGFGPADMAVMKEEIEKLRPGDVYLEIGVDEGRSFRTAYEYAKPGVYLLGIDIHDHYDVPDVTIGRAKFMEQEGMVGLGKRGFYIHGDADEFAFLFNTVDLLFIDGHHNYESVKKNTLTWEHKVLHGTILFHDIDHPDVLRWLNEYYGIGKWEALHGKIGRVRT